MALYKDQQGNIHDDMDGDALSSPHWPAGCVPISAAEADAIMASKIDVNAEKAAALSVFRELREVILGRLNGLQMDSTVQADIDAIKVAKQALKDMPQADTVIAAVGGQATKAALHDLYVAITAQINTSAPNANTAFRGITI